MAEQLLNDRYRLLRPLGTGGMASVYLAEDLRLGRRVAVKILHPQFAADPAFVARFEHEARMAAALSHPALVQVYDVGHDGDRYYIVMEYIEGETVKALVVREGAIAVPRALTIISGVLSALTFAHAHNLIHRDIKSQNVLLTPTGDIKVTDFGIARELNGAAAPTLTVAGMVIGTVQYFSPEQAQGRTATPQSDVYAAGIVLYELLTGKLPFDAENPLAVAMQQINQAPTPPRRINAAIPPAVEAIVLKAMAKNPAGRYATADDMKAAIEAARGGAADATRLSTRTTAATGTGTGTGASPVAPGVIRTAARPAAPLASRPAIEPAAGRRTQWLLWAVAVALIGVVAAIAGIYVAGGAVPGFGGTSTATPTPTPSVTAAPTATHTPRPTATRPVVVVLPTLTATHTPLPTKTATASPSATKPAPTLTHTPAPTATHTPRATDTPAATATNTPQPQPTTAVPTSLPTPTATATATSAPATVTASPTATSPAPLPTSTNTTASGGAPSIQFAPVTATAGDTVGVTGAGWTNGATVTISADFGTGTQTLDRITVTNGGFSSAITLPADANPGTYTVNAQDDQGEQASQTLTITN